jgi:hypothetical protein
VTNWPHQVRRGVAIVGDGLQLPARRSCHQLAVSSDASVREWSGGADRGRPGQNAPKPPTKQGVPSYGGILAFARTAGGAPIPFIHTFRKPALQNRACLFSQQELNSHVRGGS